MNSIDRNAVKDDIYELIRFIENYTNYHFSAEEKYLAEHNYPFIERQKRQHKNFRRSFKLLKEEIDSGSMTKIYIMFRTQILLIDWIVNHVLKEDQHFGKFIKAKS